MGYFGNFVALFIMLTVFSCIQSSNAACPQRNWVKPSRPCLSDKECYPKICCPDSNGRKSCTLSQFGHGLTKTGVYCDGMWCKPNEVCKLDVITKRRRCQRT